jgi:hypothetical protein
MIVALSVRIWVTWRRCMFSATMSDMLTVYMHYRRQQHSTSCIIHSSLLPLWLYDVYNDNGSNDEWMMQLVLSLTITLLWMYRAIIVLYRKIGTIKLYITT